MNSTVEIEINLPREEVVKLFDSQENCFKWQEGLQSFEHLSGEPGQPGAQSKLVYQMGKRRIEMIETITTRNLPDEFSGTYDAKGVHNVVENRFIEIGPDKTKWESENEFQFTGFMRLIGFFMGSAFPKQSLKYLKNFKAFAEEGKDVRDQSS